MGNGLGYAFVRVVVGFIREILGFGTILGFTIIPDGAYMENGGLYINNGMMTMPAMALILVACFIWVHRAVNKDIK